jgi:hypothetical protein
MKIISCLLLSIFFEEKLKLFKKNVPWVQPEYIDSTYLAGVSILDFNGDGVNDFIYSGRGPVMYSTSINIENSTGFGSSSLISGMDFVEGKVRRLYLFDVLGTGGPTVDGYSIVDITYDGFKPTFIPRIECEQIYTITPPKTYTSYEVESLSDTIITRYSPFKLDTPYNHILELPGNQLGKITKGTKAIVTGQTMDSLNINWFFILVKPGFKIHGYPYDNMTFDPNSKMYRMVWAEENGWKRK